MFSGKAGALIEDFSKQEQSHVVALTAAIKGAGGKPAPKPNGTFPITSPSQVANLAYTVENLGASAYLGQAAKIQSKQVLAAVHWWRRDMRQRSARSSTSRSPPTALLRSRRTFQLSW